jgi:peptidoglycan/LPS O-acetylase OafA/YrhL
MAGLQTTVDLVGVGGCLFLLPVAFARRAPCAGFLLAALVVLPVSAAITGALSAPHDRYQSRIMWLPPFVAGVSLLSLRNRPEVADGTRAGAPAGCG